MGANRTFLRAFVRLDANNRVVPSSLVLRRHKPKNGKWFEIPDNKCCGGTKTILVDITALTLATDETVTITIGCQAIKVNEVTITTTGAGENARRDNLLSQLTTIFGSFGVFTLSADRNTITFVSDNNCVESVFTVTA